MTVINSAVLVLYLVTANCFQRTFILDNITTLFILRKQISNALRVLKYGAGEGWRRLVGPLV
jgi:hypothetical protein